MIIKGLQKTTLLDFPGRVACTVFTGGCNFRCPFCHNAALVLQPANVTSIDEQEFFTFLRKRTGILDGVCITGGEPLLQPDIISFIKKIKELGYRVKLDTNGSRFELLKQIIDEGLIDYVAMDIKSSPEKYAECIGLEGACDDIFLSIQYLMNCGIDYEFRTTVVRELHTKEDIINAAQYIKGAKRYYLQAFKDSGDIIGQGFSAYDDNTMRELLECVAPYVCISDLRGV